MFKLAIISLDLSNTSDQCIIQNCFNRYKDARLLIGGLIGEGVSIIMKYLLIEKKLIVYNNFLSF